MGSYLDISIERLKDGKWVNLLNCSSSEELETVNLYKLRDTFVDCEYYDSYDLLEAIGKKRGMMMRGGEVDTERAAIMLLDEYRGGKLGFLTLESPEDL